jgi:hypothetical protein
MRQASQIHTLEERSGYVVYSLSRVSGVFRNLHNPSDLRSWTGPEDIGPLQVGFRVRQAVSENHGG